jgi:hypothetical protein
VEDYVHRIGRTARGTADGVVLTRAHASHLSIIVAFVSKLCVLPRCPSSSCCCRQAITFFTSGDSKRATQVPPPPPFPHPLSTTIPQSHKPLPQLIGVLKRAGQVVPEELARFDRGGGGGGFGGRGGGFGGRGGFGGGRGGFGGGRGGGGFRGGAFGGRGGGGFRGGR